MNHKINEKEFIRFDHENNSIILFEIDEDKKEKKIFSYSDFRKNRSEIEKEKE